MRRYYEEELDKPLPFSERQFKEQIANITETGICAGDRKVSSEEITIYFLFSLFMQIKVKFPYYFVLI